MKERKILTAAMNAAMAVALCICCHACIVASQGLKPSITTRYQVWQARLTKCDFACVKVRTRQLTALVDKGGKVSYA